MAQSQLDKVVGYYVRHICHSGVTDQEELAAITEAVKINILEETLPQISAQRLTEANRRVEEEARQYKRRLLQNVKISLIVETILIAFLVGIAVNQVTSLIPSQYCLWAIIISLVLCVLMVMLATAEPKE